MLHRLASLWRNLRHRDRVDRDLDDEVRAVFDVLVEEKIQAGLTRDAARRAAMIELGRVDAITQQVREARTGATLDALLQDIKYGARLLLANPGFTAVVVLSLAVGIGANSALFSVANAMLWRTLPVPDPDTLYTVRSQARVPVPQQVSYPFFEQLRAAMPQPDALAAMSRIMRVQARTGAEPAPANLQLVSGEFFNALHLATSRGRLFTSADNRTAGAHPVAVIADDFWRRRLGGAADVVGRDLVLNGSRFTIVGVGPAGFTGVWLESPVDVWVPLAMQQEVRYIGNFSATNANLDAPWMPQDNIRWLELIARAGRPDGAELGAVNAVLRSAMLLEADRATDPEQRKQLLDQAFVFEPFGRGASSLRTRFRAPLFVLMAMVSLLLLVACVNTANLLLARASSRQREMAVRLSIGASRGRIISQLLTESLVLAAAAAIVGLALAPLAGELLVRWTIGVDSGPLPFAVAIDQRVLAFTAVITLLTSFLFGFAPAWRATDLSLSTALRSTGRTMRAGARLNVSKMLVIAQVALSLLLVAAAGLFLRSLGNLSSLPLGYEPNHVIAASINPRMGGYQPAELTPLYRRLVDRVTTLPGVEAAAVGTCGLMTGCRSNAHDLVIPAYDARPGEDLSAQEYRVSDAYLRAAGMTIIAGRDFTPRDAGAKVAIINESMARRYFPGRTAIGERLGLDAPDTEIVGVVKDARVNAVREAAGPTMFLPIAAPAPYVGTLLIRTAGDPSAAIADVRRALQDIEPALPIDRVAGVSTLAAATFRQETLVARLATALGVIALALACLGLYGLMSYAVKQRTGELAIRFALGAPRPRVLWMVFRESLTLMAAGLILGIPLILLASRLVGAMLFDVRATDPLIIGGAMAVLLLVGATSSYLPSWRASRVDPLTALRNE